MKVELDACGGIAHLTIRSGGTTIVEDISNGADISTELISQFLTVAFAMYKYNEVNNRSDVDFVELVATMFLDDIEHEQLIKRLSL